MRVLKINVADVGGTPSSTPQVKKPYALKTGKRLKRSIVENVSSDKSGHRTIGNASLRTTSDALHQDLFST